MTELPSDNNAYRFPVSVKGVVLRDGAVVLVRNSRDEWELPGGRLEVGERPEDCVVREIAEEVGWDVVAGPLLDVWVYPVRPDRDVVIVTFGCDPIRTAEAVVSDEHVAIGLFTEAEMANLRMPEGYKRSVTAWFDRLYGRDRLPAGEERAAPDSPDRPVRAL